MKKSNIIHWLFALGFLILLPATLKAQKRHVVKMQNTHKIAIPPKNIQFTEAWVWEYKTYEGEKGEMVIYRDPKTGYWLLTEEAFGNTDGMCDWILAMPDGKYFFAYKSAEIGAKNSLLKEQYKFPVHKKMPDYFKATGKKKSFGDAKMGFPLFNASAYNITYLKTSDKTTLYVANTTANLAPLYYFNDLIADAKLPIRFPQDLPGNKIAVAESTNINGTIVSYTFKYISPTDYHISLSDYE